MVKTIFTDSLSVQQVAEQLKINPQSVRVWCKTGCNGKVLRSFKIAGKRKIFPEDLDTFLESVTTEGFEKKEIPTPFQQSKGHKDAMARLMSRRPQKGNIELN